MSQTIEKNSDVLITTCVLLKDLIVGHLKFKAGEWLTMSVHGKGNIRKINCWFQYKKFPVTFNINKTEFHATFAIKGVN